MTTKPKARKYRIQRRAPSNGEAPEAQAAAEEAAAADVATDQAENPLGPTDLEEIQQEGLTGRQLRMARRLAQKHGLAPQTDIDAVRMLRLKGIDPFSRVNTLALVMAGPETSQEETGTGVAVPQTDEDETEARVQLPQTMPDKRTTLPSTEVSPAERRAREIVKIQRDLAKRRRRRTALLLTRLAFFVLLPTLLVGYYFYSIATPMYSTKSEFLILKSDGGGGGSSFFSGTQFATNQDAIAVQSYLQSKDAMLRLDRDEGFKSHFSDESIDPIQRLEEDPSNEQAYKVYKRNIEIGYDPTEGVIRMEVIAADPVVSARFSKALIAYAEERVDNLSLRKRSNAVEEAEKAVESAQTERREAQERLVRLQNEGQVLDPEGRIAALRGQINNVEVQLQEKRLELQALLDNARPNRSRVDGVESDIRRLDALLGDLNAQMTQTVSGENSLAELAVQIQLAQADLAAANEVMQSAFVTLETSRRDANSQARYLTTSVEPVASEDPSYPRKFENTALAFLMFGGLYLMIALTASILREQITA
ncbi:capsular polysaccharide transport system permease protein [Primorskyibacter sedentarius]|uniref:Capsular polysaccharide transport system permease protein n=1 Tax=Primorskyibacter sedentarius TaxID=745311 RepID=A0A4R3JMX8_9RHOB|nr:capsule biosynthesis protein [Primorskyibacter sedentarius]TCS66591.1 capsular polysaccharide transport system permease protein [Primorskyibacter sedentarius]